MNKDIQPGKWDTSVGGHLNPGEAFEEAVYREMKEELDIESIPVQHLYDYWMRNEVETEFVRTYMCMYDGQITLNADEIVDGRFWRLSEIECNLGSSTFTPNLEQEYKKYLEWALKRRKRDKDCEN